MIDKKFGNFTVLELTQSDKPGIYYECLCHCGNIRINKATELRAGRALQCVDCNKRDRIEKEIGNKYGKWTVLRFIDIHKNLPRYESQCDCGIKAIHQIFELRRGRSKQCTTCHNREIAKGNIKHGMYNTKQYKVWTAMLDRCRNPKSTSYKWYGGRGITFDPRWILFYVFHEDMGSTPKGMTLDRIDNNGPYSKDNCRWISHKKNCQNRVKRNTPVVL